MTMQLEVIQKGKTLRSVIHDGRAYVQAPKKGKYALRVTNVSPMRRLAVLSVDGINVINGEDAGHDGPGYILSPHEVLDVPGFRRDDGTVAAFRFKKQDKSYAAQTGRGTSNVGVIGMAAFDEKQLPWLNVCSMPTVDHHHHHYHPAPVTRTFVTPVPYPGGVTGGVSTCFAMSIAGNQGQDDISFSVSNAADILQVSECAATGDVPATGGAARSQGVEKTAGAIDVGTAYGEELAFATVDVNFTRASTVPVQITVLRYATRERLLSWGVPIDRAQAKQAPRAFPAASQSVPAPPGWQG